MERADIVITQTGAEDPILTYEKLESLMENRDYRSLFVIDIAVPRDVEESCETLSNFYLYNIDDLEGISNQNREMRKEEIVKCKEIIKEELDFFQEFLERRSVHSILRLLDKYSELIKEQEMDRIKPKLDSEQDPKKIEIMAERTINKILHPLRATLPELQGSGSVFIRELREGIEQVREE